MSQKKAKDLEFSTNRVDSMVPVSRRQVLFFAAGTLVLPYVAAEVLAAHHEGGGRLDRSVLGLLENSPYVYVSPLRTDGQESRCHGEVWYGWYEGSVFLTTETKTWKARSVKSGLNAARLWVGNYGRWKRTLGKNNDFMAGPSFDALASISNDSNQLSRLFEELARKYPKGFPKWEKKMKKGHSEGSRVLLRYTPFHS